ncbi:MAG: hypothetical protein M1832_001442 [Thelocarpon impressellum]|nr:MAG: hypothetical protein M1832_001442 [Thelocarpon impressellum]
MIGTPEERLDLSQRWLSHQRQQARGEKVWMCSDCGGGVKPSFLDEPTYFNHVRNVHPELFAAAQGEQGVAAIRRELAAGAFRRGRPSAVQRTGSDSRGDLAASACTRNLGLHPDAAKRPRSAGSTVPNGRPPSKELAELNLSLDRDQDHPMRDAVEPAPLSPIRRKRAAAPDLSHPDQSPPDQSSGLSSAAIDSRAGLRRSRARPGGRSLDNASAAAIANTTFRRDLAGAVEDGQLASRPQSTSKRLFNPDTDSPLARAALDASSAPNSNATANPAATAHHFRSRREPNWRKDGRPPRDFHPPTASKYVAAPAGGHVSVLAPPDHSSAAMPPTDRPHEAPQDEQRLDMVLQPGTRPISQAQLVAEVKGIYAGLVMVEAKCIEVDSKQAAAVQAAAVQAAEPGKQPRLNNEQWQALIALHRTLLHEHHDFFLASQHPSASPALRRLATKYAMPARMWRHGIHSFLELLRHGLPASLDQMLAFIYIAYSMMALLYETVPAFEGTWIECLGDLGRYRMAIEDDDKQDREVWTGVARFWYSKAADKSCTTGRLYHHLAILARPNALQQLSFYAKSLTVVHPFLSARESIMTLFDPILASEQSYYRSSPTETAFIKAHGLHFTGASTERVTDAVYMFLASLDAHVEKVRGKWKVHGVYMAVANFAAMLGYGSETSELKTAFSDADLQATSAATTPSVSSVVVTPSASLCGQSVGKREEIQAPHGMEHTPASLARRPEDHALDVQAQAPVEHASETQTREDSEISPGGQAGRPMESSLEAGEQSATEQVSDSHAQHAMDLSPTADPADKETMRSPQTALMDATRLTLSTLDVALRRVGDPNVLPHVHVTLVALLHLDPAASVVQDIARLFPSVALANMMNDLIRPCTAYDRLEGEAFPQAEKGASRPLPEDYTIRGLIWATRIYPERWFIDASVDDEERSLELASMADDRTERVLWLACQLAARSELWLRYDGVSKTFSASQESEEAVVE